MVRDAVFADHPLKVFSLESLEKTIDEVFEQLSAFGEQDLLDEYCPYFGVIWPAGQALAEYVARMPAEEVRGKKILEIGCGLAIPGMLLAQKGALVTVSDLHPEVPRFLERNLALNGITTGLEMKSLDWRTDGAALGALDFIVGSDLVYEKQSPETLATFLDQITSPATTIILTDPGRFYLRDFMDAMTARRFVLQAPSILGGPGEAGDRLFLLVYRRT